MRARLVTVLAVLLLLPLLAPAASAGGRIYVDFYAVEPGTGFDDPAPATPVGGNPGTTLGEQRAYVFLQAAALWEDVLHPEQDIYVAAQFEPLGSGVLGAAGAQYIWSNFPGAELPNTWYFDSLADHLAGGDLNTASYDVVARFSSDFPFYLGFDNQDAAGQADLLVVVLHELGHGLNFANAVNETTGAIPVPDGSTERYGDVFSQYTVDVTTGKRWNDMTDAERAASALNVRKVSWSGRNVRLAEHRVLERGEPAAMVLRPAGLGTLMVGEASFGPKLTARGVTGTVVLAQSASGNDGCLPMLNDVRGRIALVDRGSCAFTVKVRNAQDAGALAVLIVDNSRALPPPGLGGSDPEITIPAVRISLPDGVALKALLADGVRVRVGRDMSVLAGADRVSGQVMLAAFDPVAPGSSISHYEGVASPNLIMEPAINADLVSSLKPPQDLTAPLLTDLGWFTDRDGVHDGVDVCLGSDISPTVVLSGCDSGVANTVGRRGCSVTDTLNFCAPFAAHSSILYTACMFWTTSALEHRSEITRRDQAAILRCALRP